MKNQIILEINPMEEVPFHNCVDFCIGTGRMGLALQEEYQKQLALVQAEIGFSHIRGHGLFSDDMAVYQEYTDQKGQKHAEYNFTYLDLVIDSYVRLGLKPFLELGFMPDRLASGEQTIFYWEGNVTPPADYDAWCALVQATLRHMCERYGTEEAVTWPIEVWNEPNLDVFWEHANMEEYFMLFKRTFLAVKEVESRFRVGGPAICGVDDERWMRRFLEFCDREELALDFVTRHHYTTDVPVQEGHYGYAELRDIQEGLDGLQNTRNIVDTFPRYKGLEIHITEFNTSYIPNCPLHDTNQNAAYIAMLLSRLGDVNESYSYWTFGDVFEESGVPFTPFHGGFGLVANGGIPKPTFWTFAFFKALGKRKCILRTSNLVVVSDMDGEYRGVAWNSSLKRTGNELEIRLRIPDYSCDVASLIVKTVDEETCNPLKVWHDLGEPSSLSAGQKELLKEAARPFISSREIQREGADLWISLSVRENGICYFELRKPCHGGDRGYHYNRVMQKEL